jgi:hypothetical protein
VTSERFSKDIIYNHLQRVFRLKASSHFLTDLYATGDHYIQELKELVQQQPIDHKKIITQLKLFICAYESALKKRRNRVISAIKSGCYEESFTSFHQQVTIYSKSFRELKNLLQDENLLAHFNFLDEYLSYIIRSTSLKLLKTVKKNNLKSDIINKIEDTILFEYQYATDAGFPLPQKDHSNRNYIYRIKGILKKNIWDVLYLKINRKEDAQFFIQLLYGIAAGMAMIFATLVAFFAQRKYGNFSTPLFAALVIGYIFKDRLKELLKEFLKKLIDNKTFDKKTDLISHDKIKIGTLQEQVFFIDKKRLDHKTLEARERYRQASVIRENKDDETIICYNKRLKLNHRLFKFNYSEFISDGIKNITRIDLEPFISTMDNSKHYALSLNSETHEVEKVLCLRSYHITILINYVANSKTTTERFRVVISRDGIHSIEQRI